MLNITGAIGYLDSRCRIIDANLCPQVAEGNPKSGLASEPYSGVSFTILFTFPRDRCCI